MSKLTQDCLYVVFEELEYDIKSLYSCLLVNRLWCEIIVPILWKDPWRFCRYAETDSIRLSLYNTIISFLPSDSRVFLVNHDINIFNNMESSKPLFKYISYIKSLNDLDICVMAQDLTQFGNYTDRSKRNKKILLIQEIFKIIINYTPSLKKLAVYDDNDFQQVYYFPGSQECFSNIVSLECSILVNPLIFNRLAEICHNIKELFVGICHQDNSGLIALIEVQRNLQYFQCDFDTNYVESTTNSCKGIGEALTKQAHSLISFHLYGQIKFCCSIFTKFVNLKILKMRGKSLNLDQKICLQKAILPNLQQLDLFNFSLDMIAKLIQSTGENLLGLRVFDENDFTKENTLLLIQVIIRKCPNLKFITIFIYDLHYDDYINELKKLFLICNKLEKLVLIHDNFSTGFDDYDDILLNLLVENAPTSLNSLKFECFNFSKKGLKTFFEKWKFERRQKSLSFYNIIVEGYFIFNHDQKLIVEEYIKEGVLKKFQEIRSHDRFIDWDYILD